MLNFHFGKMIASDRTRAQKARAALKKAVEKGERRTRRWPRRRSSWCSDSRATGELSSKRGRETAVTTAASMVLIHRR